MKQYNLNKNVYEATQERLCYIFKEFDNVYVSFSAGKDSGVLVNLVIDFMKKHKINKKIGLFYQDTEAQYKQTEEFAMRTFKKYKNYIEPYWFCVEMSSRNALSIDQPYWIAWQKSKKDLWVRKLPNYEHIIRKNPFETKGIVEYKEHYTLFAKWYHNHKKAGKTVCLTGVRSDESLRRYSALANAKNYYQKEKWIIKDSKDIYTAKPLYDWRTKDIWLANGKFNYDYNKVYDLLYLAGINLENMRIATPFVEEGQTSINMYKLIAPEVWQKILNRVEGVNFASLYANTKAFGKSFELPKGHTWKSYTKLLLVSLPDNLKNNYLKLFENSIRLQFRKNDKLNEEIIIALKEQNIEFRKDSVLQELNANYYKRFALAILKNDYSGRTLGFSALKDKAFKKVEKITLTEKWK